jgi:prefoldin alpha subunit
MAEEKITLRGEQIIQAYEGERRKADNIARKIETAQRAKLETITSKKALEDMEKTKEDQMMVAIGAGIYLKAKIEDKKKVLTTLAGNTMVPHTIKEATEMLDRRLKGIQEDLKKLEGQMQASQKNMGELGRAMQMIRQKQAEQK